MEEDFGFGGPGPEDRANAAAALSSALRREAATLAQAAGGLRSAGGADAVVVQACVAGDEGGVLQVDGKLGIALRLPGLQGAGGGDARQVVGQQQAAFKVGRR